MSVLLGDVAAHVFRQHRHLRQRLPDLRRLAHDSSGENPRRRHRAAKAALRFLDADVLAHADVEEAVLDELCLGPATCGELTLLRPSHDTVRDVEARLQVFVEQPDDLELPGFLLALHDLLAVHLDDEWRTLAPLFLDADERAIARLQDRFPAGVARPPSDAVHSYVPTSYQDLVQRTRMGDNLEPVARRLARAVEDAVRRAARSRALPLRDDLGMRLDLRQAVSSPRVTLIVGHLTSAELETVLAPVDVEITLKPGGDEDGWTLLELRYTLTPRHRLPRDAPAHHLAEIAIHAIIGELASCRR